jgi:hypothetical protein
MKARELFEACAAAPTEAPTKPAVRPKTEPRPAHSPHKRPDPWRRREIKPGEEPRPKAAYGMDQTYTEGRAARIVATLLDCDAMPDKTKKKEKKNEVKGEGDSY